MKYSFLFEVFEWMSLFDEISKIVDSVFWIMVVNNELGNQLAAELWLLVSLNI